MFGVEKPIIALLHLDALPGDPGYCGSMDTVLEHARQDLVALQNGGVDGILFANEFSLPYQPVADVAVISAMAYIIGALRPLIRVPYGVNVVKNPIATIDLAAATGARFARSCFSGAYMGEYGLYTSNSGEAVRHRKALEIPDMKLLYDFSAESVLHRSTLNREQATTAILDILNKFPHIGVEVMAGNGEMFVIHANEVTHAHQVDEHLGSIACPVESVPDGWVKVVFASDPESIRKLGQYAKTRYYGRENYFLATNSIYLEIMPSGVSKASGLHDLCALMSKSMKNTVVIGDYYNDLEIMREAGYAVAVANAPAEVKAAADHVTTCTCAEGAVGEYLYSLISRAEGREV